MIRAALVWRGGLAGVVVAAAGCAAIAGIGDLPGPPDASPAGGDAAPDGTRPTTRDASLEASTTHHGDATVRDAGRDAGSRVDSPASTVDSGVDGQADGHADVSSDASVRLDATADVFLPFDAACDANAAAAQTCAGADALFVGALPVGGAITPFVSTMPFGATQAYFSIQFAGNTSPSYHPHITLTSPNDEFLMNVLQDCSGTSASTTCLDNGDNFSLGVTSWETSFTNPVDAASLAVVDAGTPDSGDGGPTSVGSAPADYTVPIPPVGASGQVLIRVYRASPATPTCDAYTLTATN